MKKIERNLGEIYKYANLFGEKRLLFDAAGAEKARSAELEKVKIDIVDPKLGKLKESLGDLRDSFSDEDWKKLTAYYHAEYDKAAKGGKLEGEALKNYEADITKRIDEITAPYIKKADAKAEVASGKEKTTVSDASIKANFEAIDALKFGDLEKAPFSDLEKKTNEFFTLNAAFNQSLQPELKKVNEFYQGLEKLNKAREDYLGLARLGRGIKGLFPGEFKDEEDLRQELKNLKEHLWFIKGQFKARREILANYGRKLTVITENEKKRLEEEKKKKKSEIANKTEAEKIAKRKKYQEIEERQKTLIDGRKTLENIKTTLVSELKDKTINRQLYLEKQKTNWTLVGNSMQADIDAWKNLNDTEGLPDTTKKEFQAKYDASKTKRATIDSTIKKIDENIKNMSEMEKIKTVAIDLETLQKAFDEQIGATSGSMHAAEQQMEGLKLQYATEDKQVDDIYDKRIQGIDDVGHQLYANVIQVNLRNAVGQQVLDQTSQQLDRVQVAKTGFWDGMKEVVLAPFTLMSIPAQLTSKVMNGIGDWILDSSRTFHNDFKDTHKIFDQVSGVFAGIGSVPFKLVGGLAEMGAHPWETIKSLGSLVGLHPDVKALDAWKHMGGAIVGARHFEEGSYGLGAGVAVGNILSFFVGGEAAGIAKGAGRAARFGKIEAVLAKTAEGQIVLNRIGGSIKNAADLKIVLKTASELGVEGVGRFTGRGSEIAAFGKTFVEEGFVEPVKNYRQGIKTASGFRGTTGAVLAPIGHAAKAVINVAKLPADFIANIPKLIKSMRTTGRINTFKGIYRSLRAENALTILEKDRVAIESFFNEHTNVKNTYKPPQIMPRDNQIISEVLNTHPELVKPYVRFQNAIKILSDEGADFVAGIRRTADIFKDPQIKAYDALIEKGSKVSEELAALVDLQTDLQKVGKNLSHARANKLQALESELTKLRTEEQMMEGQLGTAKMDKYNAWRNDLDEVEGLLKQQKIVLENYGKNPAATLPTSPGALYEVKFKADVGKFEVVEKPGIVKPAAVPTGTYKTAIDALKRDLADTGKSVADQATAFKKVVKEIINGKRVEKLAPENAAWQIAEDLKGINFDKLKGEPMPTIKVAGGSELSIVIHPTSGALEFFDITNNITILPVAIPRGPLIADVLAPAISPMLRQTPAAVAHTLWEQVKDIARIKDPVEIKNILTNHTAIIVSILGKNAVLPKTDDVAVQMKWIEDKLKEIGKLSSLPEDFSRQWATKAEEEAQKKAQTGTPGGAPDSPGKSPEPTTPPKTDAPAEPAVPGGGEPGGSPTTPDAPATPGGGPLPSLPNSSGGGGGGAGGGGGTGTPDAPGGGAAEAPSAEDQNKELEKVYKDSEKLEGILREVLDDWRKREKSTINAVSMEEDLNKKLESFTKSDTGAVEAELDSVRIKVDGDGKKTYEGLKEWVEDLDKKKQVGEIFKQTFYTSPEQYTYADKKPPKFVENFMNLIEQDMKEKIRCLKLTLTRPLKVFSKSGKFNAYIEPDGKIEIYIDDEWAAEKFKKLSEQTSVGKMPDVGEKI